MNSRIVKQNVLAAVGTAVLIAALILAPRPQTAEAGTSWGARNNIVYLSSNVVVSETCKLPASGPGSVMGSVIISSPTAGGATIEVYDSSDTLNLTTAKESMIRVSCSQVGVYPLDVEADFGLAYVSSGTCKAVLKWLDHK